MHRLGIAAIALGCGVAFAAHGDSFVRTAELDARVQAFAQTFVADLAAQCPVRPVDDAAAFAACRDALFANDSVLRRHLASYIQWGRPPASGIDADPAKYGATQLGKDVFTGTYAPMWMWSGAYELEYAPAARLYRIDAAAGFRNELDFGQYPYPFWHDVKKWADYEGANRVAVWVDPTVMKVVRFTFYKRAGAPAVARSTRRHMPTFDGRWMWVDRQGREQPAPTLFRGLYRESNPHLAALDATYRKFALTMREAQCDSCHVPNNPDKAKKLILLQTPLHAASEIERVLEAVGEDRMPLDDAGIEDPLGDALKARLLADAEAFAAELRAAREWERAQPVSGARSSTGRGR